MVNGILKSSFIKYFFNFPIHKDKIYQEYNCIIYLNIEICLMKNTTSEKQTNCKAKVFKY